MSSDKPKVSVIIPVYNSEDYLQETIRSVEGQSYPNVELVFVDNCSDKASTIDALDGLRKKHKVVDSKEKGLSNARNDGIAAASGEYILPLDSDDVLKPSFIASCIELFEKEPETTVVRTNIELFGVKKGRVVFEKYTYARLLARNLMVATSMFRKVDCQKVGGYDGAFTTCFEDWEFWIRLLKEGGKVGTIEEPLFCYRIRRGSMMRSLRMEELRATRKKIWEKHKVEYGKHYVDPVETFEYQYITDSKAYKVGGLLLKPFSVFKLMN